MRNPRKKTERIIVKAMREPTKSEIAELANLWHLSKVEKQSRYDRMILTAHWWAREHPEDSTTWAYKVLYRWLAGSYSGPNPSRVALRIANPSKRKMKYPFDHSTAEGQKRLMAISMGLPSEIYISKPIDLTLRGDYGSDPLGGGKFRMIPSGDVVNLEERNRRLKAKPNPPRVKIYNRVFEVRASKAGMPHKCDASCKSHGHNYVHKFSEKACVYGLPDGSILIK